MDSDKDPLAARQILARPGGRGCGRSIRKATRVRTFLCIAVVFIAGGFAPQFQAAAQNDTTIRDFPAEEVELMRACGLSEDYALDAWVLPRMLSGDFDADDALDYAAYVRRVSDGARGVAICRAGTWLDLLGFDGPVPGSPMEADYFARVETWRVSAMEDVPGGWVGEAPRPRAAGDVLVLERVEKALYSVYWNGEAFLSHQHFRYVEP